MAISYVGAASAEATSLTLPTHQKHDLIIMCAMRASNALPTLPTGWLVVGTRQANSIGNIVAYKIAQSASESSGTWTNATMLASAVYRDDAEFLGVGNHTSSGTAGTTTITYTGILARSAGSTATSRMRSDSGYVVGYGGCSLNNTSAETAPTGMTNRTAVAGASANEIAIHDTAAEVTDTANQTVTVASSTVWAMTFEIHRTGILFPAAGGVPLIGAGGLVY